MVGFFGKFLGVIDEKGRISIPAKIRPGGSDDSPKRGIPSGEIMILTKGLDGCLFLYSEDEWEKFVTRLNTLPYDLKDIRFYSRDQYQHTTSVRVDRAGRILIPESLRELAELKRDVVLVGVNRCIEIWNPSRYDRFMGGFDRTLEEVAEQLHRESQG